MAKETKEPGEISFSTIILESGKTATGICIPENIIEKLGAGKKPPVKVTINSYTYRSTVAVMGGIFMVGVSADVRSKAGVKGGDTIMVNLELDTQPREVTLPPELKEILDKNAKAREFFEGLSFTNKQRFVVPIDQAKTGETRQRRIERAISDLLAEKK